MSGIVTIDGSGPVADWQSDSAFFGTSCNSDLPNVRPNEADARPLSVMAIALVDEAFLRWYERLAVRTQATASPWQSLRDQWLHSRRALNVPIHLELWCNPDGVGDHL